MGLYANKPMSPDVFKKIQASFSAEDERSVVVPTQKVAEMGSM